MTTLIVIDMQNDFVTGVLGSEEAVEILPNVKQRIETHIKNGNRVIFTRDTHGDNYLDTNEGKHLPVPHCIKNTHGWEIVKGIDHPECEHIDKPTFGYKDWESVIKDCNQIEIIGVCTDICVICNALILKTYYPDVEITVNTHCCAGLTPERHKAAIEVLKSCQINVLGGY